MSVSTYLDLPPWQTDLFDRPATRSFEKHHAQRLGHALTLEVEQGVVEDGAPSVVEPLQLGRVPLEQVASLAAVDPRFGGHL